MRTVLAFLLAIVSLILAAGAVAIFIPIFNPGPQTKDECLLRYLPGMQTDNAVALLNTVCGRAYPDAVRASAQTSASPSFTPAEQAYIAQVGEQHPDWAIIFPSASFAAWVEKQPPEIQALLDSTDPNDAIYLLDAYKQKNDDRR